MAGALDRLDRVLAGIVGALLAGLTLVVTFQVLGRYVPFIPRPLWTEEVSRMLLAWLVFLGAAVALRRSDHFVIDLIPRRVEERIGRPLQVAVLVLVAAVAVIALVGGIVLTQGGLTRISTASGLHLAWAFAALPVGGLFMLVFTAELAVRVLRRETLPGDTDEESDQVPAGDPVPDTQPGPAERRDPPGPIERRDPPGPAERRDPPGPIERRDPPGPAERRDPPGPAEGRER